MHLNTNDRDTLAEFKSIHQYLFVNSAPCPLLVSPPAAKLYHGHGGEDEALADGIAALPGGRSGGAQLLDPTVQRC